MMMPAPAAAAGPIAKTTLEAEVRKLAIFGGLFLSSALLHAVEISITTLRAPRRGSRGRRGAFEIASRGERIAANDADVVNPGGARGDAAAATWILRVAETVRSRSKRTATPRRLSRYPWKVKEFAEAEGPDSCFAMLDKDVARRRRRFGRFSPRPGPG